MTKALYRPGAGPSSEGDALPGEQMPEAMRAALAGEIYHPGAPSVTDGEALPREDSEPARQQCDDLREALAGEMFGTETDDIEKPNARPPRPDDAARTKQRLDAGMRGMTLTERIDLEIGMMQRRRGGPGSDYDALPYGTRDTGGSWDPWSFGSSYGPARMEDNLGVIDPPSSVSFRAPVSGRRNWYNSK